MRETFEGAGGISELLTALEAAAPSPAGGTAAAVVAAMAASLVVMVGRTSPEWPDGTEIAIEAATLRDRLVALGAEDVRAFAAVLSAVRNPAESAAGALVEALVRASEVPLEIAQSAADVAQLAARAADEGKSQLRPDANAAAILAEAATRAAASLVRVNVAALPCDTDTVTTAELLAAARAAQDRAAGQIRAARC